MVQRFLWEMVCSCWGRVCVSKKSGKSACTCWRHVSSSPRQYWALLIVGSGHGVKGQEMGTDNFICGNYLLRALDESGWKEGIFAYVSVNISRCFFVQLTCCSDTCCVLLQLTGRALCEGWYTAEEVVCWGSAVRLKPPCWGQKCLNNQRHLTFQTE